MSSPSGASSSSSPRVPENARSIYKDIKWETESGEKKTSVEVTFNEHTYTILVPKDIDDNTKRERVLTLIDIFLKANDNLQSLSLSGKNYDQLTGTDKQGDFGTSHELTDVKRELSRLQADPDMRRFLATIKAITKVANPVFNKLANAGKQKPDADSQSVSGKSNQSFSDDDAFFDVEDDSASYAPAPHRDDRDSRVPARSSQGSVSGQGEDVKGQFEITKMPPKSPDDVQDVAEGATMMVKLRDDSALKTSIPSLKGRVQQDLSPPEQGFIGKMKSAFKNAFRRGQNTEKPPQKLSERNITEPEETQHSSDTLSSRGTIPLSNSNGSLPVDPETLIISAGKGQGYASASAEPGLPFVDENGYANGPVNPAGEYMNLPAIAMENHLRNVDYRTLQLRNEESQQTQDSQVREEELEQTQDVEGDNNYFAAPVAEDESPEELIELYKSWIQDLEGIKDLPETDPKRIQVLKNIESDIRAEFPNEFVETDFNSSILYIINRIKAAKENEEYFQSDDEPV